MDYFTTTSNASRRAVDCVIFGIYDRNKLSGGASELAGQAADRGAQIICLPELFAGRYFCLHYFDEGKNVPDLERSLRLDESILRFLTVRVADEERRQVDQ